jgi:hypothetical protein
MAKKKQEWEDQKIDLTEERWDEIAEGVLRYRLPDNEPVRRIITGRRNRKVGAFYSWKMRAHVVHESDGEERCARTFDVDSEVTAFFGQPETLKITVPDRPRPERYTPDFLVYRGDNEVRVEFKRLIDIRPPKPKRKNDERGWRVWRKAFETRRHLRVARDAYAKAKLGWKLVLDVDIARQGDPETVDEIVRNGGRPIESHHLKRLLDHLRASPGSVAPLSECEALLDGVEFARGDVLARIQERRISIDLLSPIEPDTLVHIVRH